MKPSWPIWIIGVVFSLSIGSWLSLSSAWAWDGDWTEARSGQVGLFDDPDSTQSKAGTDPPQKFLTPNPRDYADVDPEELDDYYHRYNKDYSPYALARITQDLRYNNQVIPKGYYLVKPGGMNAGSPRINMATLNAKEAAQAGANATAGANVGSAQQLPALTTTETVTPATWHQPIQPSAGQTPAPPSQPALKTNRNAPVYQVFVLKRQGKVIGVVPINRMESYQPPRDQKIPKQALAWIEIEDRHPVLKFYFKKWVYCTDFQ